MNSSEHPNPSQRDSLTHNQRKFLVAYALLGTLVGAAEASGLSRTNHYTWMHEPAYRQAFTEAENEAIERAEAAVRQRAIEGVERPVYFQGRTCGSYKVYSDMLALRWLEAKRPEVWKQRIETTTVWDGDLSKLTEQQLESLIKALDEAEQGKRALRPAEIEVLRRL